MENQFTIEEVSLHNTEDDIWIIIDDNVYDITDFISKHPGGKVILLSFGGQDVSDYFKELHKPEILNEIADHYKIGVII
jgi:cytochrome b involved in lipid metabolism